MSDSQNLKRQAMLEKMRHAMGVSSDDAIRQKAVAHRINMHKRNLVPQRANIAHDKQVALFRKMAMQVSASVVDIAESDLIPETIGTFLRNNNLPNRIRRGEDHLLAGLPWMQKAATIEVATGPAEINDAVSLSRAFAGVAETGTLALTSGPDNPVTLNFLPETHIVILRVSDIVGTYEDVWDRLRAKLGDGKMPRSFNYITGPSRTADIEQKLELGAHGPRRLHIIIVGA